MTQPVSAATIAEARRQYGLGNNVSAWLREQLGRERADEVVEISYDLQAGSYTAYRREHASGTNRFADEASALLDACLLPGDQILDAGCGEATTLTNLAGRLHTPCRIVGLDLSWSRIRWARANAAERGLPALRPDDLVVGTMAALPLANRSVDVVITSHALEPNRGSEEVLLRELLRVARRRVLLLEPCYERVVPEIRECMDKHGYVTCLEAAATAAGGTVHRVVRIEDSGNPLNPTFLFEIEPAGNAGGPRQGEPVAWCCPQTHEPLADLGDCWNAPGAGLAYPAIGGIPVLRADKAVIATQLDRPLGGEAAA